MRRRNEALLCVRGHGVQRTRRHGGGTQGIPGQLAARAGALSLSALTMSAGPDSNPFEGLMVLREC